MRMSLVIYEKNGKNSMSILIFTGVINLDNSGTHYFNVTSQSLCGFTGVK